MLATVPEEWFTEAEDALLHPERFARFIGIPEPDEYRRLSNSAKVLENRVVPQLLKDLYDKFHYRAVASSQAKGEQEAMALVNFYVVFKYRLWRAEKYRSWEHYLRAVGNEPFSLAASTIKQAVYAIDEAILRGLTLRNTVIALGRVKMATLELLEVPDDKLPGGDINRAAETISALSPGEARGAVADWEERTTFNALSSVYDVKEERLYIEYRRLEFKKDWQRRDLMIAQIEREDADWVCNMLRIPKGRRAYK